MVAVQKEKPMGIEVKDGLTVRQEIVLRFIIQCIKDRGYPPILKEIAGKIGAKTESGARRHIQALTRKGYIETEKGVHRAVRPKDGVEELLEDINQKRLFEAYQKGEPR
jgi:repressor LexA